MTSDPTTTQRIPHRLGALGWFCLLPAVLLFGCNASATDAEATKAFDFISRQLTMDIDTFGNAEPGLASITRQESVCHFVCGFHYWLGDSVQDLQFDVHLADIDLAMVGWEIDGLGRATVSFSSNDGSEQFKLRNRAIDENHKPTASWSDWSPTTKAVCRGVADKNMLQRVANAFVFLAQKCGAKESPY